MRPELVVEAAVYIEHLDAAACVVDQGDPVGRRRPCSGLRIVVFPATGARRPEPAGEGAVGVEEMDAGIAYVNHDDAVARRRPVDVMGMPEIPLAGASRPEREGEGAVVRVEDLDAIVVAVGHGDAGSVGRERDGLCEPKRPGGVTATVRPERQGDRAVGVEDAHDGGAAAGRHQQVARRGIVDGSRIGALRKQAIKGAVGMVDVDAAEAWVGHGKRAPPGRMGGRRRRRRHRLHCGGRRRDVPRRRGQRLACARWQAVFSSRGATPAVQHAGPRIRRR